MHCTWSQNFRLIVTTLILVQHRLRRKGYKDGSRKHSTMPLATIRRCPVSSLQFPPRNLVSCAPRRYLLRVSQQTSCTKDQYCDSFVQCRLTKPTTARLAIRKSSSITAHSINVTTSEVRGRSTHQSFKQSPAVAAAATPNSAANLESTAISDFSDLPTYTAPTTGLFSYLPPSLIPYAELIRLDKPAGTLYLYFPCLFSTFLAAPLLNPVPSPSALFSVNMSFLLGCIIFRGAACTWNDTLDRDLDRQVARTRLRPLARGALTATQGHAFTAAQVALGTGILLAAFPTACIPYALPSVAVIAAYPLMKRVTNYPQLVLGFCWAYGAVMGFPALGIDIFAPGNEMMLWAAGSLYASGICWTLVYDYIYAHQDVKDDAKVGIKSIAVRHGKNTKILLSIFAAGQVGLLGATGVIVGADPLFYVGAVGGTGIVLATMIRRVNLKVPRDCWWWFTWGALLTGGAIGSGCIGNYLTKWSG